MNASICLLLLIPSATITSKLFLNRFFLQNNNQIEDFAILLGLGALAHTVRQAVICLAVDARLLKLPDDKRKSYDPKPTIVAILIE